MKKLNILGQEYQYIETSDELDPELKGATGGVCRYNDNTIVILTDNEQKSDVERIKLHELIHAYFKESGLSEYSHDETLVEWIAMQFFKILETYEQIKGE